jgi:hypothetical protein
MKKVIVLLAAFMLLGSVGAFAGKAHKASVLKEKIIKLAKKSPSTEKLSLVKNYSYISSCGETWECNNCQTYTGLQWVAVMAILDSLCDYPDIDEITIAFP